jgi:hypothetical protein
MLRSMRRMRTLMAVLLVLAACACGGSSDDAASSEPSPAASTSPGAESETPVASIGELPTVTRAVEVTEDNDPNDLIGRPNGYEGATVFYDKRVAECSELGVSCGATLEIWPDGESAQRRAAYIQGILKESPMLGSEYHYRDGALLLRVTGELKPSEASAYERALAG